MFSELFSNLKSNSQLFINHYLLLKYFYWTLVLFVKYLLLNVDDGLGRVHSSPATLVLKELILRQTSSYSVVNIIIYIYFLSIWLFVIAKDILFFMFNFLMFYSA